MRKQAAARSSKQRPPFFRRRLSDTQAAREGKLCRRPEGAHGRGRALAPRGRRRGPASRVGKESTPGRGWRPGRGLRKGPDRGSRRGAAPGTRLQPVGCPAAALTRLSLRRFWRRRSPMFRRSHLKILLIGNSGAGKSALMNQYVNNRFSSRYRATIGADFLSKEVNIDGRKLTVQIWDTAGTERFQALGTALYRGSDCCLLVFDVTSVSSFQALEKWHKQLLLQIEPEEEPTFPTAVIGNKMDLENREVSFEEAEMWSKLHEANYFETSAKEATNVQEVFEWAIRAVLKNRRVPEEPQPDSVHLETRPEDGAAREKCSC